MNPKDPIIEMNPTLHPADPSTDGDTRYRCPKCGSLSGDDWSQCEGMCPLRMSPHYNGYCEWVFLELPEGEEP